LTKRTALQLAALCRLKSTRDIATSTPRIRSMHHCDRDLAQPAGLAKKPGDAAENVSTVA
jgi:hypothetical protein